MPGKYLKMFGYLLAANFEAAVLIMGSIWIGKWLNVNYPKDFSWILVTGGIGFLAVCHTFYITLRALLRLEKKQESNVNSGHVGRSDSDDISKN